MKKPMFVLALLLCSSPIHAFVLLENKGVFWAEGWVDIWYNPKGVPAQFAKNDPRLSATLYLSSEMRLEIQTQIFEELLRSKIDEWSSVPDSTLVVSYKGITDKECGILNKVYDGYNVLCWGQNSLLMTDGAIAAGLAPYSFLINSAVYEYDPKRHKTLAEFLEWVNSGYNSGYKVSEAEILLNSEISSMDDIPIVLHHELGHMIGLGHEQSVPSVMGYMVFEKKIYTLQPDDMEGVRYLFPFTKECASTVVDVAGQPRLNLQVYFEGELYRADLGLSANGQYLEVIESTLKVGESARTENSCALKPDSNGVIVVPYFKLENALHMVKLQFENGVFKILEFGPA
jgi:hypothetical protein